MSLICALAAWQDSVTVGFDGQDREGIFDKVEAMLQRMAGMDGAQPRLHLPCEELASTAVAVKFFWAFRGTYKAALHESDARCSQAVYGTSTAVLHESDARYIDPESGHHQDPTMGHWATASATAVVCLQRESSEDAGLT